MKTSSFKIEIFDFPTEKMYNIVQKGASAQTYFLIRVMQHAKRDTKSTNFRRRKPPDTFRWNLSNSLVLQKTQT